MRNSNKKFIKNEIVSTIITTCGYTCDPAIFDIIGAWIPNEIINKFIGNGNKIVTFIKKIFSGIAKYRICVGNEPHVNNKSRNTCGIYKSHPGKLVVCRNVLEYGSRTRFEFDVFKYNNVTLFLKNHNIVLKNEYVFYFETAAKYKKYPVNVQIKLNKALNANKKYANIVVIEQGHPVKIKVNFVKKMQYNLNNPAKFGKIMMRSA